MVGGAILEARRFFAASSVVAVGGDIATTWKALRELVRPRSGVREFERTRVLAAVAPGGMG